MLSGTKYHWVSSGSASVLRHRRSHSGAWLGTSLCQKPGRSTPLGKRCRFTGRSARYASMIGAMVA